MVIASARESSWLIKEDVAPDREILEPDLVRASDDYAWRVGHATLFISFIEQGLASDASETEQHALRTAVKGTRDFAEVFLRYADPGWADIMDTTIGAAEEISRRRVRQLEHPDEEW